MSQKNTLKQRLLQKVPNVIAYSVTAGLALVALVINILMFFVG